MVESFIPCSGPLGRPGIESAQILGSSAAVHRAHRVVAELPHVPVGVRQGETDDRHVLSDPGDLLRPPEGEGVVVAVGEQDPVRGRALQQIVGEVGGEVCVGAMAAGCRREVERQRDQDDGERGWCQSSSRPDCRRDPPPEVGRPDSDPEAPDDEAHDEEVVPLSHLVILGIRILHGSETEPRLEVHVTDEAQAGHEEQYQAEPPVRPVAPSLGQEALQPEGEEPHRDDSADRRDDRPSPLPIEVLEVVEELKSDQPERSAGIVRPVRHGRVIEGSSRRILGPADDGEQGIEGGWSRLVDHRMLPGADVEIEVRRDPDRRDGETDRREHARAAVRREDRGARESTAPRVR